MEKPATFGFIRKAGLLQDTAYKIMQELEKLEGAHTSEEAVLFEQKKFYYEQLVKLSLKTPNRTNRNKSGKKGRPKKKVKSVEEPSNTDWSKKITGG